MERPRHDFFARAAFARQQNGKWSVAETINFFDQMAHFGAAIHQTRQPRRGRAFRRLHTTVISATIESQTERSIIATVISEVVLFVGCRKGRKNVSQLFSVIAHIVRQTEVSLHLYMSKIGKTFHEKMPPRANFDFRCRSGATRNG